jgi:hypothetical protein
VILALALQDGQTQFAGTPVNVKSSLFGGDYFWVNGRLTSKLTRSHTQQSALRNKTVTLLITEFIVPEPEHGREIVVSINTPAESGQEFHAAAARYLESICNQPK